jgi:hypothetical protein
MKASESSVLHVIVNDQPMLQFDRGKPLSSKQAEYLDKLDARFDAGIELQGEWLEQPNPEQRARWMALALMEGLLYQEDEKAAASLAWLATRLPELKQIQAVVDEQGTRFELIFDREYQPRQVVQFDGLDS